MTTTGEAGTGEMSTTAEAAIGERTQRGSLSRKRILQSALAILDGEGLAALSMRRLGAELGVDPMSVYNHVDGKDALLDGLVELLWGELPLPDPKADWLDQLRSFMRSLRDLFHAHPHVAPLMTRGSFLPTSALAVLHGHLEALREAGFDGGKAAEVLRSLVSYGMGYGLVELTCLCVPGMEERRDTPSERELLVYLGQALPPGTPPHLAETAIALYADCEPDACFEAGLKLLLEGVERSRDER